LGRSCGPQAPSPAQRSLMVFKDFVAQALLPVRRCHNNTGTVYSAIILLS
jgi:hypothetical protein